MFVETWTAVLTESFQDLWVGIISFLPDLIVAIVLFIIGWIIGAALSRVIEQIFKALKVDNALRGAGLEDSLRKTGFSLNSGRFIGELIKWFVIVVFLVAALDVLGLEQVNIFLKDVVLLYLPQVIVAVFILVIAAVIAEVMRNLVAASAKAGRIRHANFLGTITKWAIWIFAVLAALYQLGIAATFLQTLFTGVVIALSLAFGLAFGLGGQDTAARLLEKARSEMREE